MLDPDERGCQAASGERLDDLEAGRHVGESHPVSARWTRKTVQAGVREPVETFDGDDVTAVDFERPRKEHVIADRAGQCNRIHGAYAGRGAVVRVRRRRGRARVATSNVPLVTISAASSSFNDWIMVPTSGMTSRSATIPMLRSPL